MEKTVSHNVVLPCIYRIKRQALPDVRDASFNDDNAAASSTNVKPRWRNWNEDYAMGYQRHP